MVTILSGIHEVNAEVLVFVAVAHHVQIQMSFAPVLMTVFLRLGLRFENGLPLASGQLLPDDEETGLALDRAPHDKVQNLSFRRLLLLGLNDYSRVALLIFLQRHLPTLVPVRNDAGEREFGGPDEILCRQIIRFVFVIHIVSLDTEVLLLLEEIVQIELCHKVG